MENASLTCSQHNVFCDRMKNKPDLNHDAQKNPFTSATCRIFIGNDAARFLQSDERVQTRRLGGGCGAKRGTVGYT